MGLSMKEVWKADSSWSKVPHSMESRTLNHLTFDIANARIIEHLFSR